MSKNETWRTKQYWEQVGGTLVLEYPAVRAVRNRNGQRLLDGIIIKGEKREIADAGSVDLAGKDITVVQTKATRLGMYLMGQAFFSREIMRRYRPRSFAHRATGAQHARDYP